MPAIENGSEPEQFRLVSKVIFALALDCLILYILDGISSVQVFSVRFSLKEVSKISCRREKELLEIHRALHKEADRHVVVLHEMGGIGRT